MNLDQIGRPLRQVMPRNFSSGTVERRIDEQPTVADGHAGHIGTARHPARDLLPLIIFVAKYDAYTSRVLQGMVAI